MALSDLPPLALSVRQPWAWAIIHGGKVIENRSLGAIKSGGMTTGRICIHAASGLKENEYRWGVWRLQRHGVTCPRPDELPRRAIIGTVDVIDIIDRSESEWFGGPWGLVLANPRPVPVIPAKGELGYFHWAEAGDPSPVLPWMRDYDRANNDGDTLPMFPDLEQSFRETPQRPRRKT